MKYGTSREQQTYEDQVFVNESPKITEMAELLQKDQDILQKKGNSATVSASSYVAHATMGNDTASTINDFLPELRSTASIAARLSSFSGIKTYEGMMYEFEPRASRELGSFSEGTCSYASYEYRPYIRSSSCALSFYILSKRESVNKSTFLDSLYVWNLTESNVFLRFKIDIPQSELLKLQDEYRILWKKILEQPSEERTVNLDSSFEAPFVASID